MSECKFVHLYLWFTLVLLKIHYVKTEDGTAQLDL